MNPLITYLAPPALGAFIGYMTNKVAIRMLFRPLRPWHIFGIRVPMTPGVIPGKRRQLATNIGEMVGGHLLTSADVKRALTEKGFQKELDSLIQGRTEDLLSRQLGPLPAIIPDKFRSYFEAGVKILRWRSLKYLHSHLDGDTFSETLTSTITASLDSFLQQPLSQFVDSENRNHLYHFLNKSTCRFLAGKEVEKWIQDAISTKINHTLASGKSSRDLLPDDFIEEILTWIEGKSPELLEKLADLLKEPVMHDRIASFANRAISGITESMGPMAAMLTNFIDPEMIDQKVREYLSEKGDEISDWLFDENVRKKVAANLREKAEEWLNIPLANLCRNVPPEKITSTSDWIAEKILNTLRTPETAAAITAILKQAIEAKTEHSLNEIISEVTSDNGLTKGKHWVAGEIITIIRSPRIKKVIDNLVIQQVEQKLLAHPVGTLKDLLPSAVQNSMGDYLLHQVSDLLIKEVPGLVDTLNIRLVVAKKVDSLDLLRLENLLMGIMQEQFKYINLFGALLGFLIGLLNLAIIFYLS